MIDLPTRTATIALSAVEVVDCRFTNIANPGWITIIKEADPKDGTDFLFGGTLGPFTLDDAAPDDGDGVPDRLTFPAPPGTHTVTEMVPDGWTLDEAGCNGSFTPITNGVSIQLDAEEEITCTFTNRALQADLSVEKTDSPDPVDADEELTYTITVSNDGPDTARTRSRGW